MAFEQEVRSEQRIEKEPKFRMRRAKLAGLAHKLAELATELEKVALELDERERNDEGRTKAILNSVTGGAIEHLLAGSVNLSESDRSYLKVRGWKV